MSDLSGKLEGLDRLVDHFGYVPDFHDWTITSFTWVQPNIRLEFEAFRMTSQVEEGGYFVCDRRARVVVDCKAVSAWDVRCGEGGIVGEVRWMAAREIPTDARVRLELNCAGPRDDDVALAIEPAYGIEGWISCGRISFNLEPIGDESLQ